MTSPAELARWAADRWEIQDVLLRYFQAADRREWDLCQQVFAEDVTFYYNGQAKPTGRDQVIEAMRKTSGLVVVEVRRRTRRGADATEPLALKHAMHFVGQMAVTVTGDTAMGETSAIAHVFYQEDGQDYAALRGIRYLDRLVRMDEGWRISERTHTLEWSREVDVDYCIDFSERRHRL